MVKNNLTTDILIKPWYSYKGGNYDGALPAFYDQSRWPALAEAEKLYPVFKNEIEQLLSAKTGVLEPYYFSGLTKGKWEVLNFYFWGNVNDDNCAACPQLGRFLKSMPEVLSATVSKLAPHSEIQPHIGDTNLIARCHLGLTIPARLPNCGIEVNNEQRSWEEGKWLIFCDAYQHSAWNRTDKPRFVLIIDLILPEFITQKKDIVANVRSLLKLQKLTFKAPWIKQLPGPVLGMLRHFFKFMG
jgi:hypothetical protein